MTGKYVAFSLREAVRQAKSDGHLSPTLSHLGGMTRLVGLVHDQESQDAILIGKVAPDRPAVHLDDLVVALRARLLHAIWPLVSIDPTPETQKSGLLTVKFEGEIANTRFGRRFLDCDILLKRYSMGLLGQVPEVQSYGTFCERSIRNRLHKKGISVHKAQWLSTQGSNHQVQNFYQRPILLEESFLSRFWFWPLPSSILENEEVFFIRDLRLGVSKEVINCGASNGQNDSSKVTDEVAADSFATCFTEHYPEMAAKHASLMELETLHAMIAAAECIATLDDQPDLDYFLYDYELQLLPTEEQYDLIELQGTLACSDGSDYLVRVSGGIELRTLLKRLNGGDFAAIRQLVLGSRPNAESLCWAIPLASWNISNDNYRHEQVGGEHAISSLPKNADKEYGFSVFTQTVRLAPSGYKTASLPVPFVGFSTVPVVRTPLIKFSPFNIGGVHMSIKSEGEKADLSEQKKKSLEQRPGIDSLSWPIEIPERK